MNTVFEIKTRIKGNMLQARITKFNGFGLVPSSNWFDENQIRSIRIMSADENLEPHARQALLETLRRESCAAQPAHRSP